jgi:nuclear pore complex protein Nup98-Nup96
MVFILSSYSPVHFRHKETVVYPDDSIKPPVGEGINVPAEITMERIWPIDKSTQEPIKSPTRVKNLNYEEKLRRSCKRMDAVFISYDPTFGVWIFQVTHVYRYVRFNLSFRL